MGQYYYIINADRKEYLNPFDYNNGLKLMEWSYDKNYLVLALENLMSGAWMGDRVYVVGDYADLSDVSECWAKTLESLLEEFGTEDLYGYVYEHFLRVLPEKKLRSRPYSSSVDERPVSDTTASVEDNGFRYLYNHKARQVIDLEKCPIEWGWWDAEERRGSVARVSPLSLLLTMGNGRGGGDYRGVNAELLGSWCADAPFVELSKEPLLFALDYEELAPDFTEREKKISWTDENVVILEAKEEREKWNTLT